MVCWLWHADIHSQCVTNIEVGHALSSWSNVGRLRFDQHFHGQILCVLSWIWVQKYSTSMFTALIFGLLNRVEEYAPGVELPITL